MDEARAPWTPPIAFACAVLTILIYSNGWQLFLLGPKGDADASALARAAYIPAYAATILLLVMTAWRTTICAVRAPLLWLLVGIAFVSTLWSVDPDMTERRSIALLLTTLSAVVIAARYEWDELAEVLATAFGILAVVSFFLGLLVPSWGRMTELFPGAWRGVWSEKNALGDHMAQAIAISCAAAALNRRRRWLWLAAAALELALVVLSTSKTSVVGLSFGMAAFVMVYLVRRGPASAVAATFGAVTAVLAAGAVVLFASDKVLSILGKDATLTGRTNVWGPVIRQAQLRPWTGYGYGAVWDDQSIWGPFAWITKEAKFVARASHDSWLEVWLGTGYVGLGAWIAYFVEIWSRALLALYRIPGAYLALPVLTIYSLTTITESEALNYNDFVWQLFAIIAVRLATPSKQRFDR
jgi:O-antigen ligase